VGADGNDNRAKEEGMETMTRTMVRWQDDSQQPHPSCMLHKGFPPPVPEVAEDPNDGTYFAFIGIFVK